MNTSPGQQHRQILRLSDGVVVYAAVYGAVVLAWLTGVGTREGWGAVFICALPGLAALWARFSGLRSPRSAMAKVLAIGLFGPVLLLFWAGEQLPATVSAAWFVVPAMLLHAAVFVGSIVALGQVMTRVEAVAGVPPVSPQQLRQRLVSLSSALPAHCRMVSQHGAEQGADTLVFELPASSIGERHHRVLLTLFAAQAEARVREQLSAIAAWPADADERSLRDPAAPSFDPGRPEADRVWSDVRQTTMLEPEQVAAVSLRFEGDAVRDVEAPRRGEGVLLALCAVVTRSGWAWQPAWCDRRP